MIKQLSLNKFSKYSWGVLAFNMLVILWGAYVRATGSGAGCGNHWPDCKGEIIPREPQIETLIEYSHRLSSGVAFILVLFLLIFAMRLYPKGSTVRLGASLSMFFMVTEALVGAALVKFQWVAQDISLGRVISISVHLVNTFLLIASLTLTAWWASGGKKISLAEHRLELIGLSISLVLVIMIGISGAITALGDTLFPTESLLEGIKQDFSPTAHYLLRLRVWHPVLAIFSGLYIVFTSLLISTSDTQNTNDLLAKALGVLFLIQLVAGLINLFLLAPIPMQLIHLLLADLVWISLILFTAATLSTKTSTSNEIFLDKNIS
jgi:protoheme IX farnesyltransferase